MENNKMTTKTKKLEKDKIKQKKLLICLNEEFSDYLTELSKKHSMTKALIIREAVKEKYGYKGE